jgi:hypothetical protein
MADLKEAKIEEQCRRGHLYDIPNQLTSSLKGVEIFKTDPDGLEELRNYIFKNAGNGTTKFDYFSLLCDDKNKIQLIHRQSMKKKNQSVVFEMCKEAILKTNVPHVYIKFE